MSLVDAVAGFNHVKNTPRAREMLALLWRTGQFLPICLTFGPHNGPDDFSYVVDRVYAPGARSKRRFCKEWLAYVDDLTVRTGKVVDGVVITDEEYEERISHAIARAHVHDERERAGVQSIEEAFKGMGFGSAGVGKEKKSKGSKS